MNIIYTPNQNINHTFKDGYIYIIDGIDEIKLKKSFSFTGDYVFCPTEDSIYIFERGHFYAKYINVTQCLLITIDTKAPILTYCLNQFLTFREKYKDIYLTYLSCKNEKLCTTSLSHSGGHWGHKIIDTFSPLFHFIENNKVERVYDTRRLDDPYCYFTEKDIFDNKLYNIPIRYPKARGDRHSFNEEMFLETCNDNLYFFQSKVCHNQTTYDRNTVNAHIPEKVINFIQTTIYPDTEIDAICANKKVILLVAKKQYRYIYNQLEVFDLIINHYKQKAPNTLFLFQGFTKVSFNHQNYSEDYCSVHSEQLEELYNTLIKTHKQNIINLNNMYISKYIAYVKHVDLYFAGFGSQQHIAHIFSKRNGVLFASNRRWEITQGMYNEKIKVLHVRDLPRNQISEAEIKLEPKLLNQPPALVDLVELKKFIENVEL